MNYVWWTLRIILAAFLSLLLLSTLLRSEWLSAVLSLVAVVAVLLPGSVLSKPKLLWLLHPLTRVVLVLLALLGFAGLFNFSVPQSIYASDAVRTRLHQIYDEKMKDWPGAFEDRYVNTRYGKVHVVVSGKEGMPPLMLFHASGVSSWSWKYNVEGLGDLYRIYAVDLIGDAGKSEFTTLDHVFHTRQEQADHYVEIANELGIGKAYIAGASEGGFIATNYALHYPDRVKKLALIGPMGYSGAVSAIARIALTALFPIRPLQDSTFAWAFSQNVSLQKDFGEWFHLLMDGTRPIKVPPLPFTAEERQRIHVPVLFIFGKHDNLVGDTKVASALVQDIPDVTVAVLSTGHLVAAEQPFIVTDLLRKFFGR